MLSSVMSPTAKTTVSLYLELLLAIQSHSKVLRSPSDRYFQFVHHPLLSHTNASFSTLACHVQHRLQLGVFRRTAIQGQFRVEWLQSSYRNFEWGYSVDFFRIEDYEPGKLCFGIFGLAHFFLKLFFFSFQERKLTLLTPLPSSSSHSSQTSGAGRCGNLLCSCIMIWLFLNRCCDTTFLTTQLFSRFFFFLTLSSLQRHWDETQTTLIRKK